MENPDLGNVVEKLQNVIACRSKTQQSTTFPQHLVINLYNELYSILEENTLGKRLKKARLKLKLSQKKLAQECGLSSGAIAGYEYDTIHPSKDALIKLGKIIDLKYLCCDDYSKFIISNYIEDLKSWRQKENLSMRAAAKNLGIPSSTYVAWENGTYTISKDNYYKIKNKIKELAT